MRRVTGMIYLFAARAPRFAARFEAAVLPLTGVERFAALLLTDFLFSAPLRLRGELAAPSPTNAALTQTTAGRPSITVCQVLPLSLEPKTLPLLVPKYMPAGSHVSVASASRTTVSRAFFCGRPRVSGSQLLPALLVR